MHRLIHFLYLGLLNYILEHLIEFNKFDDALEILIESCAMNEVPYIKYFSDVINGFRMSYEYDKALATYDLMLEGGLTPKMITFCRVVECAVSSHAPSCPQYILRHSRATRR